jgi:hypothetical protein
MNDWRPRQTQYAATRGSPRPGGVDATEHGTTIEVGRRGHTKPADPGIAQAATRSGILCCDLAAESPALAR